jgi:hypothetical protein
MICDIGFATLGLRLLACDTWLATFGLRLGRRQPGGESDFAPDDHKLQRKNHNVA